MMNDDNDDQQHKNKDENKDKDKDSTHGGGRGKEGGSSWVELIYKDSIDVLVNCTHGNYWIRQYANYLK